MKEIKAFKCESCGAIYKIADRDKIYNCESCGKEICENCCAFDEDYCDDCYEESLDDESDDYIPDCIWQDMVRCNPDLAE